MSVLHITDQSFQEIVLDAKRPILVDFWAEWCGPCKRMHEYIDDVANEFSDQLDIGKLNVDEGTEMATRYNIMGVPAFYLFKDGHVLAKKVGALSKEKLIEWIKETIESAG